MQSTPVSDDDLLTPEQAAQRLGLKVNTLAAWRSRRQGPPYIKLGPRTPRYSKRALEAYIAAQGVSP